MIIYRSQGDQREAGTGKSGQAQICDQAHGSHGNDRKDEPCSFPIVPYGRTYTFDPLLRVFVLLAITLAFRTLPSRFNPSR